MLKKKLASDPRNGWYEIGPDEATQSYESRGKNRTVQENRCKEIAKDITSGFWRMNGEPIIFDHDGRLHDGQHRMRAVMISGKPIVSYVVFLPKSADIGFFDTIDTGANRTAAHRFDIAKTKNYATAAATTRLIVAWDRGWRGLATAGPTSQRISIRDLRLRYDEDPEGIDEAVSQTIAFRSKDSFCIAPAILAFVYYQAVKIDPAKAMRFLAGAATGENLSSGDPILALRNRLLNDRREATGHLRRVEVLIGTIKAWNEYLNGRRIRKIQMGLRQGESFPEFAQAER